MFTVIWAQELPKSDSFIIKYRVSWKGFFSSLFMWLGLLYQDVTCTIWYRKQWSLFLVFATSKLVQVMLRDLGRSSGSAVLWKLQEWVAGSLVYIQSNDGLYYQHVSLHNYGRIYPRREMGQSKSILFLHSSPYKLIRQICI